MKIKTRARGPVISIRRGDRYPGGRCASDICIQDSFEDEELSAVKRVDSSRDRAGVGPPEGMVAGQAHDLEAESERR